MRKIVALLVLCFMPICLFAQTYKMYQTRNYHNQLRLNTATGEVLQVQDDGQSWKICDAMEDGGETDNRFCLYETQNMWTFNNMSEEGVSKVIGTPFIDGREANRVSCILQTICIQRLTLYENK